MTEHNTDIQTLYHYTDFNAMRGIICKGEIWLWNLRRMNDRREMDYFVEKLKIALKNKLSPDCYPVMELLFDEKLKNFNNLSSYAACFSEYSDDAAQWARYAKNGMGVCIAFNKDILAKIGTKGNVPLQKVSYSQNIENLEIVQQIAEGIEAYNSNKSCSEETLSTLFHSLISNSPLFKHPSFISEKEYRLVSPPFDVEKYLGKPNFWVEETNIKKYFILKLKDICTSLGINYTDLFTRIYIGPQAIVTENVLGDFFESSGVPELRERIVLSECPLRRF